MNIEQQKNENIADKKFYLRYFCFFVFLYSVDRLSKLFFVNNPDYFKNFYLFQLSFSINKNIAFSLAVPSVIIFLLVLGTLVFLFYLLIKNYRKNNFSFVFFLSLIIIGALSNLFDRIKFGWVIDFIYVPHFTVFNFADIYITFGVVLWLWNERRTRKQ
ncbi:MAG: signal peptidase II [bacterium]